MLLNLKNIQKSFDKKEVLTDISFQFEKGKIYALLGRNGAGKTTLFNILAEELKEDSGEVTLDEGASSRALTTDDLAYVYSSPILPPEFVTLMLKKLRFFLRCKES